MRRRKRITGNRLNTPKEARRYRASVIEQKLRNTKLEKTHKLKGSRRSNLSFKRRFRTTHPVRRV